MVGQAGWGANNRQKKLEANSPQIAGEDEELWKRFIIRDFGADAVDKWVPKNPTGWSKVYDVCLPSPSPRWGVLDTDGGVRNTKKKPLPHRNAPRSC